MSSWDERYAQEGWAFGTEPNDFLKQQAHRIPEGQVLCLGEGEGRNAVFLAEQGCEVIGVDRSQVGLDKALALAHERGVFVETVVSAIEDFDLTEGEWDGIVSVFFHLPKELRGKVHQSVVRGLAPGGILILEAYTPRQLEFGTGGPPPPRHWIRGPGSRDPALLEKPECRRIRHELHTHHYPRLARPPLPPNPRVGRASGAGSR